MVVTGGNITNRVSSQESDCCATTLCIKMNQCCLSMSGIFL